MSGTQIIGLSLFLTFWIYFIPYLIIFLFNTKEHFVIWRVKKELKEGEATGRYYRKGFSIDTRCDFEFSFGRLSSELCPYGLFGYYDVPVFHVEGYGDNLNKRLIASRLHSWLQSQSHKGIRYEYRTKG